MWRSCECRTFGFISPLIYPLVLHGEEEILARELRDCSEHLLLLPQSTNRRGYIEAAFMEE